MNNKDTKNKGIGKTLPDSHESDTDMPEIIFDFDAETDREAFFRNWWAEDGKEF